MKCDQLIERLSSGSVFSTSDGWFFLKSSRDTDNRVSFSIDDDYGNRECVSVGERVLIDAHWRDAIQGLVGCTHRALISRRHTRIIDSEGGWMSDLEWTMREAAPLSIGAVEATWMRLALHRPRFPQS